MGEKGCIEIYAGKILEYYKLGRPRMRWIHIIKIYHK
jgi:hypothetical protein